MTLPAAPRAHSARTNRRVLLLLVILAAALRLPGLGTPGYTLDELWTAEITAGRGSQHLHLPTGVLLSPPPELYPSPDGRPAWRVWTGMEVTHPPLYFLLLRLWTDLLGQGDVTERMLSVLASLAAVAILFDVTLRLNGRAVAVWACLLMAVASTQIDFGRKSRNYALAFAATLAVADVLVRIEQGGATRKRLVLLGVFSLAAALTHYFAAGTLIGLGLYAAVRLRGVDRRKTFLAFAGAAVVFAVAWGPFFWRQRALFSVTDSMADYVHDVNPHGHFGRVLYLLLIAPAVLLVGRIHLNSLACGLAVLYAVPFLLHRRRPGLLLWGFWLSGTLGAIAALDFTRSSFNLGFVRYVVTAGPAVFVLVPAVVQGIPGWRWVGTAVPVAVLGAMLWFISDGYTNPAADPREIVRVVGPQIGPADVVVFASTGDFWWTRDVQYMMLSRYIRPIPCPVVFLDGPAAGAVLQRIRAARSVIIFTSSAGPSEFLPGFVQTGTISPMAWGQISVLKPSPA